MAAAKSASFAKSTGTGSSKKVVATAKALSAETIIDSDTSDSDDDSDDNTDDLNAVKSKSKILASTKPAAAVKSQPIPEEESSGEDDEVETEDSSVEEAAQEEESSSSDEDSEHATNDGSSAPKVNGMKRKTTSQDDTITEEEPVEEQRASKKSRVGPQSGQRVIISTVEVLPRREYLPPNGYKRAETSSSSELSSVQLRKMKAYHITAPPGLPLDLLESVNIKTAKYGKALFEHDGIEYTIVETPTEETSVLLPMPGLGYKVASHLVTKSYSIRPVFTLPTIPARAAARNAGSAAAANIATAAITTIRPQPTGLRMRFKPPGFGTGNPGVIGGDSDDEQDSSIFQFPKAVGPSTDGDGTRLSDSVAKKKKKDKPLTHAPNGIDAHAEPTATPTKIPASFKKMSSESQSAEDEERRRARKEAKKAAKRQALSQA